MAFLTLAELKTAQHLEIIDSITREDDTIVEVIIEESISLMKGYLNSRYDVDTEFAKEAGESGDARNLVLLKMLKAIVVYEIYSLHDRASETITEKYKQAIEWMKMVQSGKINPDLELPTDETTVAYVKFGSNDKRVNQY